MIFSTTYLNDFSLLKVLNHFWVGYTFEVLMTKLAVDPKTSSENFVLE